MALGRCRTPPKTCLWHLPHSHRNGRWSPMRRHCKIQLSVCRRHRSSGPLQEDTRPRNRKCRRCLRRGCSCLRSRTHNQAWSLRNHKPLHGIVHLPVRIHHTRQSLHRSTSQSQSSLLAIAVTVVVASISIHATALDTHQLTRPILVGGFCIVVACAVHAIRQSFQNRRIWWLAPSPKRENLIVEGA